MKDELINKAVTAGLGLVVGWVGQSLAFGARLQAVEASQARIEARLDQALGLSVPTKKEGGQ